MHGEAKLTRREQQTLEELLKGLGNKEIASAMGISLRTAKFHVSELLRKFKVRGRVELAGLFAEK